MESDAASLNRMLLDRMEELCAFLLPNGKKQSNLWLVGGIDGQAGESLKITMTGSAAGRFNDFAEGGVKGASPLWLWSKVKNIKFGDAIKEAKDWLGVRDEDFGIRRHKAKSYARPPKAEIRLSESNTPVMDYLTVERRLDPIVVTDAKVCETDDGEAIVFPFYDRDAETGKDQCCHRKFLKLARPDGKKDSWTTPGTKRCLYGKNLIKDDASELIICEGEIDALTWQTWKLPGVSVPNGVQDFEWVDIDWEWLARFERIYVSMDMDDPGKAAAQEICKRLGLHRCYIVTIPKKDANACLQDNISRDVMLKCLSEAKPIELEEIKKPSEYTAEVLDYYNTDPSMRGVETPWTPVLPWRVRKGELTILTGFSGHGKALSLDTKIPTPTGWKTMGELFPGDQVFDQDGNPCNVTFATPVQIDRTCYEVVFSDGSKVVADAEHLWETWTPHARNSFKRSKNRVRTTNNKSQLAKTIQPSVVTTEEIKATIIEDRWASRGHHKHGVPLAKALQLPDLKLPVDPYCLGAWLGDGSTFGATLFCGRGDETIIEQFEKAGYAITPHKLIDKEACPSYGIGGIISGLREAGVLANKHIPEWYLRSSIEQRLHLLQGLMDTDGFIDRNGHCEFCTMLPNLATQFKELVISLGIRATVSTGIASVNGKMCGTKYRIHFSTQLKIFRLARKLERMSPTSGTSICYRYIVAVNPIPSVPVKCITVDSPRHLYLCGESMIPTHNTAGLNQFMLHMVANGLSVMDASLEIKPGMTLYNMTRCALGRKFSPKAEVEGCINWINEAMFFLDCIGTVNVKRLVHAMEYARKRHGIDVFVIDSLFKCGLSSEDYGSQREFADILTTFCNNTGAHVILVAHSRKTSNGNELTPPTKSDVAGSSDLTNAAFNVIVFWRNKLKKKMLDKAREENNFEEISKWIDQPDGRIIVDKQRFGEGEEREVSVWFDPESCQFHTVMNKRVPYFTTEKAA